MAGVSQATAAKLQEQKDKAADYDRAPEPAPAGAPGGDDADSDDGEGGTPGGMDFESQVEFDADDAGVQNLLKGANVNVADKDGVKRFLEALGNAAERPKRLRW
eukprot:9483948-Pyramimonas_sp.AAC.1